MSTTCSAQRFVPTAPEKADVGHVMRDTARIAGPEPSSSVCTATEVLTLQRESSVRRGTGCAARAQSTAEPCKGKADSWARSVVVGASGANCADRNTSVTAGVLAGPGTRADEMSIIDRVLARAGELGGGVEAAAGDYRIGDWRWGSWGSDETSPACRAATCRVVPERSWKYSWTTDCQLCKNTSRL